LPDLTVSELAANSLTTSSESFADNDTTLMTSAAINDRIESFGYITSADGGNAQTLDSLDSTSFLRSDAADTKTSGNLTFSDDVRAVFGTGSDLQIYHDGSNSYIDNTTGHTYIRDNGFGSITLQPTSGENSGVFNANGSVELYHDNSKKLETTSTGIKALGNINLEPNSGSFRDIGFGTTDDTTLVLAGGGSSGVTAGNIELVRNGNINIDGTNINLRTADASSTYAQINSSGASITGDLTITSTDAGSGEDPNLKLFRNSSSPADSDNIGTIQFQGKNDADQTTTFAEIQSQISDVTDGTEDGVLYFQVRRNGGLTSLANISGSSGRFNISNGDLFLQTGAELVFEGATSDGHETTLTVTDPTADRTITLPNATGTVSLLTNTETLTNKTLTTPVINGFSGTGNGSITGDLTLTSTDAGATENPTLDLYRNSASPADSDIMGHIHFSGENSAGEKIVYAEIESASGDVTDGTEDGVLNFRVASEGNIGNARMQMLGNGRTSFLGRDVQLSTGINLVFEGSTANAHETTLTVTDPTADRTITLPDATGTVQLTDGSGASLTSLNASQLSSGTVPNARLDAQLQDVAGLAVTNGGFIVGDGSNFVLETGSTARASLELGTAAVLDTGISNTNVPKFTSGVADNDFLRVDGTAIEGRSASEVLSDIGAQASLTFGISNTNAVKIDSTSVADNEFARFTANGLESRSTSEVLSDIGAITASSTDTLTNKTINASQLSGTIADARLSSAVLTTSNSDAPTTTTSSSDADFVLVDDGGTMKKITPSNLGITSGGTTAAFATAMAMVL